MKKTFISLIAGILSTACGMAAAGYPYILNKGGVATNLTVYGTGGNIATIPNLNSVSNALELLINAAAGNAGLAGAVTNGQAGVSLSGAFFGSLAGTSSVATAVSDGVTNAWKAFANAVGLRGTNYTDLTASNLLALVNIVANANYTNPVWTNAQFRDTNGYAVMTLTNGSVNLSLPETNNAQAYALIGTPGTNGTLAIPNYGSVPNMLVSNLAFSDGTTMSTAASGTGQSVTNPLGFFYNVKDYGAYGDCIQLTNATMATGSDTLNCAAASFTVADVGKKIQVVDAMGTGTNLSGTILARLGATSVQLSLAAEGTNSGQVFYGHDDTAAIQRAIDLCCTNGPGGNIYAPDGAYFIDGPFRLIPGASTSGYAQLVVPTRSMTNAMTTVRIYGSTPPNLQIDYRHESPSAVQGAMFVSARTAPNTTNYTIIGAPEQVLAEWGFTYIRLALENLSFRTQRDGRTCPLNLCYIGQHDLNGVSVDVGVQPSSVPRYNTYGIIFPTVNNNTRGMAKNVTVVGFKTGMRLGECGSYDQINSALCSYGFELRPNFHGLNVGYAYAIFCGTGIVTSAESTVANNTFLQIHWDMLDSEGATESGYEWAGMSKTLVDAGNILYGDIWLAAAGQGGYSVPQVDGATNLNTHIINKAAFYGPNLSVAQFDTQQHIALYLGASVGTALPGNTYSNAAMMFNQTDGSLSLSAKGGTLNFYNAFAGNPMAVLNTNGFRLNGGAFSGNASGLTNANASTLFGSGTVPLARLPLLTTNSVANPATLGGLVGFQSGTNLTMSTNLLWTGTELIVTNANGSWLKYNATNGTVTVGTNLVAGVTLSGNGVVNVGAKLTFGGGSSSGFSYSSSSRVATLGELLVTSGSLYVDSIASYTGVSTPLTVNGPTVVLQSANISKVTINSNGLNASLITTTNGYVSNSRRLLAPVSITPGSSPLNFTNSAAGGTGGTNNINVFIDGAGVTGTVGINGTTVFSALTGADATIPLQPGEYVTVTWSLGTPTMFWKPF